MTTRRLIRPIYEKDGHQARPCIGSRSLKHSGSTLISVLRYLRRSHTPGPFSGKSTGASNDADPIVPPNKIDLATKVLAVGLKQPLRFGVEVEHQGLSFAQVAKIVSHVVRGRVAGDGPTEIYGRDGRIWQTVADGGGVEVISPILQGPEDLAILQQIVAALRDAGGVADQRAGVACAYRWEAVPSARGSEPGQLDGAA